MDLDNVVFGKDEPIKVVFSEDAVVTRFHKISHDSRMASQMKTF